MAWSAITNIMSEILAPGAEAFSDELELSPDVTAHVRVETTDPTGLVVGVYSALEDGAWDVTPVIQYSMAGDSMSFVLRDIYIARLGLTSPGGATVTVSVRVYDRAA